jgi:hypothetical protein
VNGYTGKQILVKTAPDDTGSRRLLGDGTEAGSGEVWSRGGWDGGQWRGDMNVKVASTKAVRYAVAIKQGGGGVMWGARWKGPGVGSWQSAHSAMSGVSIQIHPKDKFNNLKSADPQPW